MKGLWYKWEQFLSSTPKDVDRIWLFERLIYVWFLGQMIYFSPVQDLLWGAGSVMNRPSWPGGAVQSVYYFLLYNRSYDTLILMSHLVVVLIALVGCGRWVPKVLVYLTGFMLYYAAWPVYNGGSMLMLMYAFYAVFIHLQAVHPARKVISNLAILACRMQLVLVYALAALYKWTGSDWLDGTALYKAMSLDAYTQAWPQEWLGEPYVLMGMTYAALAYQTLFPTLIWWKPARRYLLWAGIGFHAFILLTMRIPDFATAMLVGYVLFADGSLPTRIRNKIGHRQTCFWARVAGGTARLREK